MEFDIISSLFTTLLTVVGTTIAVNNYLNNRFDRLRNNLSELVTGQAVDSAKIHERMILLEHRIQSSKDEIEEKFLHLEHRVVSNKELVEHRTGRFLQELKQATDLAKEREHHLDLEIVRARDDLTRQVEKVAKKVSQIENFLAKGDYQIRD